MCKQLKRLMLLADCPHLNKTDRDAVQWAIDGLSVSSITKVESKPVVSDVFYPTALNADAWELWLDFRKIAKFKKYKSDAPMNKLMSMGDCDEQLLIVQQSIDNEYQGLFALKGNSNDRQVNGNNARTSQKKSAYERAREANNEYRSADVECRGSDERQVVMGTDGGHLGGAMDAGEGRATLEHVDNTTFIDYE